VPTVSLQAQSFGIGHFDEFVAVEVLQATSFRQVNALTVSIPVDINFARGDWLGPGVFNPLGTARRPIAVTGDISTPGVYSVVDRIDGLIAGDKRSARRSDER